jgi:hypothetical protein
MVIGDSGNWGDTERIHRSSRLIWLGTVVDMRRSITLRIWFLSGLAAAVLASLLAGCGSGEPASAAPLTKKEFVKQGNALCDAVLAERDERAKQAYAEHIGEYERLPKAGQVRLQAELALENDLPLYKKLVLKLRELPPPAKDQKTVDRILSHYESLLDRLFENPEKLDAAEPLAPNAEAASYGLISCNF